MTDPLLLDTTLRDGEQSPGIYFTSEEKIQLAEALDELGVSVIEAGVPQMGKEEKSVLRELCHRNLKADVLAWNRLAVEDVKASLECGVEHIHVSVPTSLVLLSKDLRKDSSWIQGQMDVVVGFALREGLTVSLGAEDASRTDPAFLASVFKHAEDIGVTRVRYADTLGILTPDKTKEVISFLTQRLRVPLDFHAHNDFGLATANSLAAWQAGARMISCSVMGMGERVGNTSLEEFIGTIHFLENGFPDFNFLRLKALCTLLSKMTDRPIPLHKPLFGKEIFRHESGIHVDGLLKDGSTYELFPPETVGGKRELIVGKHSGRAALKYLARQRGVALDDAQSQDFLNQMRAQMAVKKKSMRKRSFQSIYVIPPTP
ncbi:MAG: hypothetical protein M0P13_09115 [Fibrobacteraceae bacterium]|nr:hypothetical protein [Fibrobacteraceae bacterium]